MTTQNCLTSVLLCTMLALSPVTFSAIPAQVPEEIIVNPPESFRMLHLEIRRAQENMFNVFNAFNEDDRFDVHCDNVQRWGSKIRQQVCTPVYVKTAQEQEAQRLLGQLGFAGAARGMPGVAQMDHYNAQFADIMKAMFEAQPEFRRALNEYNSLTEYLNEARQQLFK